jgi:hydroxymethylglutaryl-CoA synthase
MKYFGKDWKEKCEHTLLLAKHLGNIYTGSLYNGLMTLLCDENIDLKGKKIMMFAYGSGCASSMFFVRVVGDYKHIQQTAQFKHRLANRIKLSAEEYDKWMAHRESLFGKANYEPTVTIFLFLIFSIGFYRPSF